MTRVAVVGPGSGVMSVAGGTSAVDAVGPVGMTAVALGG
jgi:hypothetical protein